MIFAPLPSWTLLMVLLASQLALVLLAVAVSAIALSPRLRAWSRRHPTMRAACRFRGY